MRSLVQYLTDNAQTCGDKIAMIFEDQEISYRDLDAASNRVANNLIELGVRKGDRVSLYLPNCVDYVLALFGVAKAGAVANPLNSMLKQAELEFIVENAGACAVVTNGDMYQTIAPVADKLSCVKNVVVSGSNVLGGAIPFADLSQKGSSEALPLPDLSDNMYLAYSSGTTGHPKGVVHTHASATAQAVLTADHMSLRPFDRIIEALPLFHLFGGNIILGGVIVAQASLIVHQRFNAEQMLQAMHQYEATMMAGVPTMFAYLVNLPEDTIRKYPVPALEDGVSAGAPLPESLTRDFDATFGARLLNFYGITEAAGNLSGMLRHTDQPSGSAGFPYPLTEIRVVDDQDNPVSPNEVGELIARGPQIMKEYWGLPEASTDTLRGGFLHTGDLARMDENGIVFVVDRLKDMIITGGFNIYPAEVENVICSHPKVAQAAVFAVHDALRGEIPWAAIVLKSGEQASSDEMVSFCREQMAHFKCPRHVIFVQDLPKSSVGKVLRRSLRSEYGQAAESDAAASN